MPWGRVTLKIAFALWVTLTVAVLRGAIRNTKAEPELHPSGCSRRRSRAPSQPSSPCSPSLAGTSGRGQFDDRRQGTTLCINYDDYLKSPYWKAIRRQVLARADHRRALRLAPGSPGPPPELRPARLRDPVRSRGAVRRLPAEEHEFIAKPGSCPSCGVYPAPEPSPRPSQSLGNQNQNQIYKNRFFPLARTSCRWCQSAGLANSTKRTR